MHDATLSRPAQHLRRLILLLCLTGQAGIVSWAQTGAPASAPASAPAAVHTQEALRAALDSGQATPFDALTPYGKRTAIRHLRWNERGLTAFDSATLVRELDHAQLAALLNFLDATDYLPMFGKLLLGPPLRLPAPSAAVEKDLQLLEQFAEEDDARRSDSLAPATQVGAPEVLRRYRELFGARLTAAALASQPPGDLLPLFDAAGLAANGNPSSSALDDLLRLHRELSARGIDTRRTLDDGVLHALLAARRFGQARDFAAARPHLADVPIPRIVDTLGADFKGRSVFSYDRAGNTLTRLALPSPAGKEMVLVVDAGCHNAEKALLAIRDDAALRARLQEANLVLLTPPEAPVPTGFIAAWNAANPAMPLRAPYDAREWQAIQVTGIPSFYLLEHGRLVGKLSGWSATAKAELAKLLDAGSP